MNLADIDWGIVALRGGGIIALWLTLWLIRHYSLQAIKKADHRMEQLEFSEKDHRILNWIIDIILLLVGIWLSLMILNLASILFISAIGPKLIALVLVWTLVWVLVRYLSVWVQALDEQIEEIDIDPRDLKTMDRLVDWVIIIIGVIASLAVLEVTSLLYSALTAAGVIGVVVGFAVKDVAANFISGIFLLIDRPFVVGDAIMIKNFAGTVSKISLRSTEIITFDGPVVSIPNSTMAVEPTLNYTLSQQRRVMFIVSLLNNTNIDLAVNTIREALTADPRVDQDQTPSITVSEIRDYAVDLQIIAYTSSQDFFETQSDLQKEIVTRFAAKGIELAVPLRLNLNPGALA